MSLIYVCAVYMSKRALHDAARARTLLADYTCEVRGPKQAQEHRCTLSLLSKGGRPEHTATGEWCPRRAKAEESAAAACLLTLDSSSTGPTRPPKPSRTAAAAPYEEGRKPNPRRLLYLLNNADRDEVCRLHRQWRDRFSPTHLSCAWTVLGRSLASEPAAARGGVYPALDGPASPSSAIKTGGATVPPRSL